MPALSHLPSVLRHLKNPRWLAGGVAGVLALAVAVGAGAAPSPFAPVSEVLGLGGEHGAAVSQAVHDAKANLEEGEKVGPAVSEAACMAAHDRSTLPHGEDVEGEEPTDGEEESVDGEKDCTHPSNAETDGEENGEGEEGDEADEGEIDVIESDEEDEPKNHGAAVSQAVHDAKANLEEGEKVGPAVSEAACTAAHDRGTLPDSAVEVPPGRQGKEKDCTHPSNRVDGESAETQGKQGKGRASAPGQLKKSGGED